jgi:2-C-methyl-D-erythritol 4-phosphate cytidylyltransferase
MIHDGNRCLVSSEIISDSIAVFHRHGSAVTAIPCVEAVFRSSDNRESSTISIDRELLFRTQTPHTYTLGKLLWAHEEAERRHITGKAASLLEFLKRCSALKPSEIAAIPPTSIMREFIGGQTL